MKKFVVLFIVTGMLVAGSNAVYAKAIGGKIIYNKMMDDYKDAQYENNLSGGVFFEIGPSFYDSVFRPGFDWVTLENNTYSYKVYSVHLDWVWFFMKGKPLSPFIGFGPAFNYRNYDSDRSEDDDSDAGIEGIVGLEYNISGPWSLYVDLRFIQHDIADLGDRMLRASVGVVYYF